MAKETIRPQALVACAVLLLAGGRAGAAADRGTSYAVRRGFAKTFVLSGAPSKLQPVRVRGSRIEPADAKPGEITVGLAPAGGAVGVTKLHVFERTKRSMSFSVVAMRGAKRLATEKVCGHLDLDTWISLPAETTTAVIGGFVEDDCN